MDVKIKLVERNGICYSNGDNCVIDIPDDMLLKLGRKYFELASKDEKKDTTNDEIMECARKLKAFCHYQGCYNCPFVIEATGGLYGCKIGCRTGNMIYTPDNWEV